MATDIEKYAEALWESKSKKNWESFRGALKKSEVKYYNTVFTNGVNKLQDLGKSYVELYDSDEKLVTKIPIYMKEGKKIEGATIYLVGLLNVRKGG